MSSSKGPWEDRTRDLLLPRIAYIHKCADIRHAGRAKLDFIGVEATGFGFIVEVKQAPLLKRTLDWNSAATDSSGLSHLQRMEMQQAAKKGCQLVIVAVGMEDYLHLYRFAEMEKEYGKDKYWPINGAYAHYKWSGPKSWKEFGWRWY